MAELLSRVREQKLELSEATFRKYVQLGLLPRSVRVGTKGKHRGSVGLYPASTVERVVLIKRLLRENFTIDEIKTQILFLRTELDEIEARIERVLTELGVFVRERYGTNHLLGLDLGKARAEGEAFLGRLEEMRETITSGRSFGVSPEAAKVVGY